MMSGKKYVWFVVAGGCFVAAALVFGGRSLLLDWLGTSPAYRTVIAAGWVLLAAGAGAVARGCTAEASDGDASRGATEGSTP